MSAGKFERNMLVPKEEEEEDRTVVRTLACMRLQYSINKERNFGSRPFVAALNVVGKFLSIVVS